MKKQHKNKIVRGALFYADLEPIKGSEQGGVRPVIILQNDFSNMKSPTTIIAPITTKKNCYLPTHVLIKGIDKLKENSIILTEQIRTIDKTRLKGFVCFLNEKNLEEVNKALEIVLDL